MNARPTLIWFYQDLRLADHAALRWAAARGPVLPLYIRDATTGEGAASKWWIDQALRHLAHDFAQHQITLILRSGDPLEILRDLIRQTGAGAVAWTRRYEPHLATRDAKIAATLAQDDIDISIQTGFLLFEPARIRSQSGGMFKVYTPFSKACLNAPAPAQPLPAPKDMRGLSGIASENLDQWHLIPRTAQWPAGLAAAWQPGEETAHRLLNRFIADNLTAYQTTRDRPDIAGTSRLSPYLHFGHLSPRQVWHALPGSKGAGAERYLLELLWREFSWHLLHGVPDLPAQPLQKSFAAFPWRDDAKALQAWQRGLTGYPIVDAGMRELWQTGWMHNRVRMIAASFLIKDLLIDWRQGMQWFWDTLVDADLGNNSASWQWVAGCGADAAPYFRIFNPTLQGQKFDPHGAYIRRFVPELAKLDAPFIHAPWQAPAAVLAQAGVVLGKTYPLPVVDHGKARLRALNALKRTKGETGHIAEAGDLFD